MERLKKMEMKKISVKKVEGLQKIRIMEKRIMERVMEIIMERVMERIIEKIMEIMERRTGKRVPEMTMQSSEVLIGLFVAASGSGRPVRPIFGGWGR